MEKARYLVNFDKGILEKLEMFPKTVKQRIKKAIQEKLELDPVDHGKRLSGELRAYRSLRVGDYRIIYKVFDQEVVVFIVDIDHRKDVYG